MSAATDQQMPARRSSVSLPAAHRYWYPLSALVRRDIKKRYASTMLGVTWTVLQPLTLVVIYVVVFGFILRSGQPAEGATRFVYYMLCGMLPYLAIADGLSLAMASLREDRALLDRVDFPAEVVPASRVVSASVAEVVGLLLLIVFAAISGMPLTGWILLLPLLVMLRAVMTCGIAWVLSTLSIFVADLAQGLSLLLTAWLFLTPIFYTMDAVPSGLRIVMVLNPLSHIVAAYRGVLLEGRAPFPESVWMLGWAAALGTAGLWFFRKTLDRGKDLL